MVVLRQCCCGCNLTQGVLIIGWLEIILHIIVLTFLGIALSVHDIQKEMAQNSYETNSSELPWVKYGDDSAGISVLYAVTCFRVMTFIASILLVVGSMKQNKKLLLPYLVLQGLYLIVLGFYLTFMLFTTSNLGGFVNFLGVLSLSGIFVYLYLAIVSLYQEITEKENQPRTVSLQPNMENGYIYPSADPPPAYYYPPAYNPVQNESEKFMPPANYYPTKN